MAIEVKHKFQSTQDDSANTDLVQPSNWNDTHDLTLDGQRLLGRHASGNGEAQEIELGTGLSFVGGKLVLVDYWAAQPIGVPIPVMDNITGVAAPPTNQSYRYVKLTASDGYNSGVLTSESVSGSAPDINATAQVNLPASPLHGRTIRLVNTERRFLRGGSAGTTQGDAIRNITGDIRWASNRTPTATTGGTGVFADSGTSNGIISSGSGTERLSGVTFDASTVVPTANENRPRNIGVTYYMRVL